MKQKITAYVKMWEGQGYSGGIPDEADSRLEQLNKVPSYRKICLAILKNDHSLKTLGLTPKTSIYYSILKRIELKGRKNRPPEFNQLKINYEN